MKFPEKLNINGKEYILVKERRGSPMAVYKFDKTYLRIGDKKNIEQELKMRDTLKEFGFPIPRRFKEGQTEDGMHYYTEKSMGSSNFIDIFVKDIEKEGVISEKSFSQLMAVVKDYAVAQLKTKSDKENLKAFEKAINIKDLYKGFKADEKVKIEKMFEEAKERLSVFPLVLTHGDFNPHNLYRQGVIDFEELFYAPVGYDIVTCVFNQELFPVLGDYEVTNPFRFSTEQKQKYYDFFDNLYLEQGIPRLSDFAKYFEFCRAIWLLRDREDIPKVQDFRIEIFRKMFLQEKEKVK
jgi:hypothetical protein